MTQDQFQGKPCDIWAFGMTIFAYYYRTLPFMDDNIYNQLNKIMYEDIVYPEPQSPFEI